MREGPDPGRPDPSVCRSSTYQARRAWSGHLRAAQCANDSHRYASTHFRPVGGNAVLHAPMPSSVGGRPMPVRSKRRIPPTKRRCGRGWPPLEAGTFASGLKPAGSEQSRGRPERQLVDRDVQQRRRQLGRLEPGHQTDHGDHPNSRTDREQHFTHEACAGSPPARALSP
jgi:hypothetical protein